MTHIDHNTRANAIIDNIRQQINLRINEQYPRSKTGKLSVKGKEAALNSLCGAYATIGILNTETLYMSPVTQALNAKIGMITTFLCIRNTWEKWLDTGEI